jgi:hypothetical protein
LDRSCARRLHLDAALGHQAMYPAEPLSWDFVHHEHSTLGRDLLST